MIEGNLLVFDGKLCESGIMICIIEYESHSTQQLNDSQFLGVVKQCTDMLVSVILALVEVLIYIYIYTG